MITEDEITEVRRIASKVKNLKNENYDSITWEAAIKTVVEGSATSEDDNFRKTALLDFFIDEEKQLCTLSAFLANLDASILDLKTHAKGYGISESERVTLAGKIEKRLLLLKAPTTRKNAFDYYQLLIDKVFISTTLEALMTTLCELSSILEKFYPDAFPEVHLFAKQRKQVAAITSLAVNPVTKKQMVAATGIDAGAVSALLYRLAQLGVFEVGKMGREKTYRFKGAQLDVNVLRKEWDWLWAQPHKKLSLRLYE